MNHELKKSMKGLIEAGRERHKTIKQQKEESEKYCQEKGSIVEMEGRA